MICINDKWGYIDRNGQMVIAPIYELARGFNIGLAPVRLNGKWGYIHSDGTLATWSVKKQ